MFPLRFSFVLVTGAWDAHLLQNTKQFLCAGVTAGCSGEGRHSFVEERNHRISRNRDLSCGRCRGMLSSVDTWHPCKGWSSWSLKQLQSAKKCGDLECRGLKELALPKQRGHEPLYLSDKKLEAQPRNCQGLPTDLLNTVPMHKGSPDGPAEQNECTSALQPQVGTSEPYMFQ